MKNKKNSIFGAFLGPFYPTMAKWKCFQKNQAPQVFRYYNYLRTCQNSENKKTNQFWENVLVMYVQTYRHMDRQMERHTEEQAVTEIVTVWPKIIYTLKIGFFDCLINWNDRWQEYFLAYNTFTVSFMHFYMCFYHNRKCFSWCLCLFINWLYVTKNKFTHKNILYKYKKEDFAGIVFTIYISWFSKNQSQSGL